MDPVTEDFVKALRAAEAVEFPPVPDDIVYCDIRNMRVTVSECATSCADPTHRPVCWMGRIYREEPMEGGGSGG